MRTTIAETVTGVLVSNQYLNELIARGKMIYDSQLKERLEPEHNNEYVVIHIDAEDYAVAKTFREAKRAMIARHSLDGRLFGRKIGTAPDDDGLTTLVITSELNPGNLK